MEIETPLYLGTYPGGMNNYPIQLLRATYTLRGKFFFLLRTFLNKFQLKTSYRVKQALKNSNMLLNSYYRKSTMHF